MWDPYAEFEKTTLPNGLTVYAAHWPNRPWEALITVVHTGASHDPVRLEGLAHFVEHLAPNNTKTSFEDVYAYLDACGGHVSLWRTGFNSTQYGFLAPVRAKPFERILRYFGEILFSARLEKHIEEQRHIITAEYQQKFPNKITTEMAWRKARTLYPGHWLERMLSSVGTPESVASITPMDLQACYDRHYTPANMTVVSLGGRSLDSLACDLCESPFGDSKPGKRTPPDPPIHVFAPPLETRVEVRASDFLVPTDILTTYRYKSVARIPCRSNIVPLRLFCSILNQVMFDEIRERRSWVYSIASICSDMGSFYEFEIECKGLLPDAVDEICEVVDECVANVAKRNDLFTRFRNRFLAAVPMYDDTGEAICVSAANDLNTFQRIVTRSKALRDFQRVTFKDVLTLLELLKPEMRWTAILRP